MKIIIDAIKQWVKDMILPIKNRLDAIEDRELDENDALDMAVEVGLIDPVADKNGAVYVDKNGVIYTL